MKSVAKIFRRKEAMIYTKYYSHSDYYIAITTIYVDSITLVGLFWNFNYKLIQ